jgi:hypothetical protein
MFTRNKYDDKFLYNFVYILSFNCPIVRVQNGRALVEGNDLSTAEAELNRVSCIQHSGSIF